MTVISDAVTFHPDWSQKYSARRILPDADTVHGVANVLFPNVTLQATCARESAYERGWRLLERAKAQRVVNAGWGTYYERLTKFDGAGNQIETAIQKINNWGKATRTSLYFHTSAFHLDKFRTRGAPCLQYVQLDVRSDETIALSAVYRNHDFFCKAFGNFVGLGRTLKFICKHTGRNPAEITCVSMSAYADRRSHLQLLTSG